MAGPIADQFLIYDTAVLNWLKADYDILAESMNYIISTPHRNFAEVESSRDSTNEVLKVPRITIFRGDHAIDPIRFNSNKIRKLGYSDANKTSFYQAQYPVPIMIPYQIDFWTEYVAEMNLLEQKLLFQYAFQYKLFDVTIDSTVWTDKQFMMFLEGGLSTIGNEDGAGTESRILRRTFLLRAEGWLYDQEPTEVKEVKRIVTEMYDLDTETEIESVETNRKDDLYTATGAQTVFTGATTEITPLLEHTVCIYSDLSGLQVVAIDDGSGNLAGQNVTSGTVNYTTGEIDITYTSPPDAGTIIVTYFTDLS